MVIVIEPHIASRKLGEKVGKYQYIYYITTIYINYWYRTILDRNFLSHPEIGKYVGRVYWESHVDKISDSHLKKCAPGDPHILVLYRVINLSSFLYKSTGLTFLTMPNLKYVILNSFLWTRKQCIDNADFSNADIIFMFLISYLA